MPIVWLLAEQEWGLIKIPLEAPMGTVDKQGVVTMQELLVSSLATAKP